MTQKRNTIGWLSDFMPKNSQFFQKEEFIAYNGMQNPLQSKPNNHTSRKIPLINSRIYPNSPFPYNQIFNCKFHSNFIVARIDSSSQKQTFQLIPNRIKAKDDADRNEVNDTKYLMKKTANTEKAQAKHRMAALSNTKSVAAILNLDSPTSYSESTWQRLMANAKSFHSTKNAQRTHRQTHQNNKNSNYQLQNTMKSIETLPELIEQRNSRKSSEKKPNNYQNLKAKIDNSAIDQQKIKDKENIENVQIDKCMCLKNKNTSMNCDVDETDVLRIRLRTYLLPDRLKNAKN